MLFLTKNGHCRLMSTLVVKTVHMGTMFTKQCGSHTLAKLTSLCRRAVMPMEFCLVKGTISIFCRIRKLYVRYRYLLACSFLPCCSALLILCIRARARLGRSGLKLRGLPTERLERAGRRSTSVSWNCRRKPGICDSSLCDSFGNLFSIHLSVSSLLALIAID